MKGNHSISQDVRALISNRYKRITKAVNGAFWDSESDSLHSFYVGSYGRKTAISTSDLDVLFELPDEDYERFTSVNGNGPSRLLQAVKDAILSTYPSTSIRGDGQVVVVSFSDGMVFEVLPAFRDEGYWGWDGKYKYPDTHMGGNWLSTNPKAEQAMMKEIDDNSKGLLFDTCKHIRYIRDTYFSSYKLSGILIDSFVSMNIGGWRFLEKGEQPSELSESYEDMLLRKYNEMSFGGVFTPSIYAPGSNDIVDSEKGWDTLGKVLKYMT